MLLYKPISLIFLVLSLVGMTREGLSWRSRDKVAACTMFRHSQQCCGLAIPSLHFKKRMENTGQLLHHIVIHYLAMTLETDVCKVLFLMGMFYLSFAWSIFSATSEFSLTHTHTHRERDSRKNLLFLTQTICYPACLAI